MIVNNIVTEQHLFYLLTWIKSIAHCFNENELKRNKNRENF